MQNEAKGIRLISGFGNLRVPLCLFEAVIADDDS